MGAIIVCSEYDVLGSQSDGGYAELVRAPIQNVVPIPDAIGFVEAAAFPLTFLTAWHMLVTRAKLSPGEDVLVLGAGSGVGQAAIQIAWLHGARVFATAGSDEKLARAREIGAYEAVNHHTQDVPAEIRRFTNNRGVDVVIEHVGEATWDRSLKCMARGGRLVTCGATTGYKANIDLRFLFSRQYSLMGSYMGTKARTAAGGAVLLFRTAEAGCRSDVPAGRGGGGARLPRTRRAVWEGGSRGVGGARFAAELR